MYVEAARRIGSAPARSGLGLVHGGGRVGLMGTVADTVLAEGGCVIGVIPYPLATSEVAHDGPTELYIVPGMHERKALMAQKSAGLLTLPGGIGTFEEWLMRPNRWRISTGSRRVGTAHHRKTLAP